MKSPAFWDESIVFAGVVKDLDGCYTGSPTIEFFFGEKSVRHGHPIHHSARTVEPLESSSDCSKSFEESHCAFLSDTLRIEPYGWDYESGRFAKNCTFRSGKTDFG